MPPGWPWGSCWEGGLVTFPTACPQGPGASWSQRLSFILFLAALGLRCYAWAFSSCGERGLLFLAVRRLFIVVASLVAEHGL